jgi:hypothetical protein
MWYVNSKTERMKLFLMDLAVEAGWRVKSRLLGPSWYLGFFDDGGVCDYSSPIHLGEIKTIDQAIDLIQAGPPKIKPTQAESDAAVNTIKCFGCGKTLNWHDGGVHIFAPGYGSQHIIIGICDDCIDKGLQDERLTLEEHGFVFLGEPLDPCSRSQFSVGKSCLFQKQ